MTLERSRAQRLLLLFGLSSALLFGCSSTVTDGADGGGGQGAGEGKDPCFDAAPPGFSFVGDGSCQDWQAGTQCQFYFADTATSLGGVVECKAGTWESQVCPFIDTQFGCPSAGTEIDPCPDVWAGLECPWAMADAGGSCSGRATCEAGTWVSLGVDASEQSSGP